MQIDKQEKLESWLALLCQMVPGISQALLRNESKTVLQWPQSGQILDDVLSAAKLSAAQNKSVTTILSTDNAQNSVSDMVIALPITAGSDLALTLAIQIKIKPSQQTVVMQILHWGEDWLTLLMSQSSDYDNSSKTQSEPAKVDTQKSVPVAPVSRWLGLFGICLLFIMAFIPGDYRVAAPVSLEGKIQRVIVAPFDGYIANAFARAGETVKKGDVLAELDNRKLILKRHQYEAEKNEYTRQYRQALGARDQAQAHIFKSQVNQSEAQIQLLQKQIKSSTLLAPLDGMIIEGDLSRSLGSTVETGDILFEISPLNEFRLVILVDEKQVVDVVAGMTGVLSLKALQSQPLSFTIVKVSPVFEEHADKVVYRVEARLDSHHLGLKPGMQGIAKIEVGKRSFGWIYLHELYDAIRLFLWSWLP